MNTSNPLSIAAAGCAVTLRGERCTLVDYRARIPRKNARIGLKSVLGNPSVPDCFGPKAFRVFREVWTTTLPSFFFFFIVGFIAAERALLCFKMQAGRKACWRQLQASFFRLLCLIPTGFPVRSVDMQRATDNITTRQGDTAIIK